MSREQRKRSVVEWLAEVTKDARREYCPVFKMETFLSEVKKVAQEAAERGLYCAEYVFEPPYRVGSTNQENLHADLVGNLLAIYGGSARIFSSRLPTEDVWVAVVSWRPADKLARCSHDRVIGECCDACEAKREAKREADEEEISSLDHPKRQNP